MAVRGDVRLRVRIDGENNANAALDSAEKKVGKLDRATGRLERSSKKASKGSSVLSGGLGKLGLAAAGAFAALAAGKAVLSVLDGLATHGDKIAKSSKGIGLTADQYQELDFAMNMSGLSMDVSANAFAKLARVIRDAADGSKMATDKLGRLGISATDATGAAKGTHDVFLEIADAIQSMGNETEKTAVALDFFEESGFKLIPLLDQGSAGLKRMAGEAHRVGAVLGGEALDAAVSYKDATTRMDKSWTAFLGRYAAPFMVAAARVMDGLSGVGSVARDSSGAFVTLQSRGSAALAGLALSTEKATNRILTALAGQSRGMAQALNTTVISAQFSAMVNARAAEGAAAIKTWSRAARQAEEDKMDPGTIEGFHAKARAAAHAQKMDIIAIKAQATRAMAAENRLIQVRIGALHNERALLEGKTQTQIDMAKQMKSVAKQTAVVAAARAQAEKDGTTAAAQSLEAAQTELEMRELNLTDLVAMTKEEAKSVRRGGARARVQKAVGLELADQLNLLRSILVADGNLSKLDERTLAHKEKEVAILQAMDDFNAGKITQQRSSLLMTIAENKHRGDIAKISKSERIEAQATAAARKDSAKSAIDELVTRPQAVPLGVSFDLENMFEDIARQFGGLGARLHAEGERVISEALGAGAITDVEAQLARETMLVESRLSLMTQLGEGLAHAGAAASQSADTTVAAIGRMSTALGQNAGAIAKGGASAIAASGRVAASLTEDVRLQAAIQGAFETAAGFADLAKPNPLGAGLHFASAGLFFALAATGAKGGGGAAASGGQSGGAASPYGEAVAPEGGGVSATTVIFNAPILAGDSQEAAQQISDVMSGNVGTGMEGGSI